MIPCQRLRLLGGRQVATRQHADLEPLGAQALSRLRHLLVLERVILTTDDVERNGLAQRREESLQIPSLRVVLLVLGTEAGGAAQEAEAVTTADHVVHLGQLLPAHVIGLGEHPHPPQQLRSREARVLSHPGDQPAHRGVEGGRRDQGMAVRVGEVAAVNQDDAGNHDARVVPTGRAVQPAAEQLQHDQRGVVEAGQERGLDPLGLPERLDQVGALHRAVGVVGRLVGVALPHVLHEELRSAGVGAQFLVDLRPAKRAVRVSGHERGPDRLRQGGAVDSPPDGERVRTRSLADLAGGGVVGDARAAREPVGGGDPATCGCGAGGFGGGGASRHGSASRALCVVGGVRLRQLGRG